MPERLSPRYPELRVSIRSHNPLALVADPWKKAGEKYKVGSKYAGQVARLTNFGAFVTLEPGLDGLVPNSGP